MLDLLSKVFGPHRAVSIYVFLQNRGLILLAIAAFATIVATLLLSTGERKHEHQAFLTVPVISTTPVGKDIRTGLIATIRLPEGHTVTVTTTEGNIAASVTATACIEQRRYVDTGEPRYRLKLRSNCTDN